MNSVKCEDCLDTGSVDCPICHGCGSVTRSVAFNRYADGAGPWDGDIAEECSHCCGTGAVDCACGRAAELAAELADERVKADIEEASERR